VKKGRREDNNNNNNSSGGRGSSNGATVRNRPTALDLRVCVRLASSSSRCVCVLLCAAQNLCALCVCVCVCVLPASLPSPESLRPPSPPRLSVLFKIRTRARETQPATTPRQKPAIINNTRKNISSSSLKRQARSSSNEKEFARNQKGSSTRIAKLEVRNRSSHFRRQTTKLVNFQT
jgi:hypothetical protein